MATLVSELSGHGAIVLRKMQQRGVLSQSSIQVWNPGNYRDEVVLKINIWRRSAPQYSWSRLYLNDSRLN